MSVKKIPLKEISLDTVFDSSQDEEEYMVKMEELDTIFETYDKTYYQLAMEGTEIEDKILMYLLDNIDEFFEI